MKFPEDKMEETNSKLKWIVLIIAAITSFLTTFIGSSINIALPTIAIQFKIDAVLLNWAAAGYLLTAAMFLVPCGRLADIYGRKKIFTIGILIFIAACVLSAVSPNEIVFLGSRVINGIGSAMIFGTGMAMVTSVFPPKERGKAFGINVAAVYLGLSVGPVLGGLLTEQLGWRSVFWFNVPFLVLVLVLVISVLREEWIDPIAGRFDKLGSITYAIGLLVLMLGFSWLPKISGIIFVLSGLLILILFIIYESKIEHPVLNINLFQRNITFRYSNLAALINYSATFGIVFLLSLYLQYIKEFSPQQAGFILLTQPAIQTILSPIAGILSDKWEPRWVSSIGMGCTTIGLIILSFLNASTPLWSIFLALGILGIGFALFSSPNTNAIMSSVTPKHYGVASGTVGTMRLIGQTFSMGIIMILFASIIGPVEIKPELYPEFLISLHIAFILFSVLCALGIVASLRRGKIHDKT